MELSGIFLKSSW